MLFHTSFWLQNSPGKPAKSASNFVDTSGISYSSTHCENSDVRRTHQVLLYRCVYLPVWCTLGLLHARESGPGCVGTIPTLRSAPRIPETTDRRKTKAVCVCVRVCSHTRDKRCKIFQSWLIRERPKQCVCMSFCAYLPSFW